MPMFIWGAGSRKGLRRSDAVDSHSGVHFVTSKSKIQVISVGKCVAAFLRGDGNVDYLWFVESSDGKLKPGKQNNLDCKEKIKEISCGGTHVILISHGRKCLVMDSPERSRCRPMENLCGRHITQVACGDQHSIALSKDGQLFTWGQNSSGQLGLGKGEPSTLSPQPLKSLAGIPLSQISAGGDHSFALSLSGAAFGWGKNSAGQLGLGDHLDRPEPVALSCLNLKKTIFISCGAEHTAILVKEGVVFTCGSGRYGQLGHNSLRDELRPRLVAELWGSKVSQVACGRYHTLALIEPSKVYSFGRGDQGQLGNGNIVNQCIPLPVHLPDHNLKLRVTKLIAGGNLSFALCDSAQDCKKPKPTMRRVAVLDEKKIDKWISSSNSSWKEIMSEIKEIFSSASSINGSFLEAGYKSIPSTPDQVILKTNRSNEHYKTSAHYSGLDLSLARVAFEKFSKTKILSKVSKIVELHLLPSLSPRPAGVEALRVYLILPELLRVLLKQDRGTELAVSLAGAILRLHPDSLKVLGTLWSSLSVSPDSSSFIRALVTTFCSVSGALLDGIDRSLSLPYKNLQTVVEVLQRLFEATQRSKIPENLFQIRKIKTIIDKLEVLRAAIDPFLDFRDLMELAAYEKTFEMLESYPCIFDLESKYAYFKFTAAKRKRGQYSNFTLIVRRTEVLDSALSQLRTAPHSQFNKALQVTFEGENGQDIGGVSRAFFNLITKEFITKGKAELKVDDDSLLISTGNSAFLYIGMIFGMALYNHCTVKSTFPQALFKKLLGLKPTLEDLMELLPTQARGLQELLEEDDEETIENMYLDFTVKDHDLIQNGQNVIVTKANREQYVDLFVDHMFVNTSVSGQFEEFAKGFELGCPCRTWTMFQPDELMNVLCGDVEYQWEELKKNAIYLCSRTDQTIEDFWEVFFELSEENKKRFLSFVRGTDRLPVGGLSKLRLTLLKWNIANADDHYPQASTCFMTLTLPNYSSIDTLRNNLIHAINHCEEFGCN